MHLGCQRFLCSYEERYQISIEYYLSVFARGLGIEHEDKYKKYRLWRDPERVLADITLCMEANQAMPDEARLAVARIFPGERTMTIIVSGVKKTPASEVVPKANSWG